MRELGKSTDYLLIFVSEWTSRDWCVCVCETYLLFDTMIGDNGRLQYLTFCLFEVYVSVVFVIRCLYSAVSSTLVKE